jgi:hypothetical protein
VADDAAERARRLAQQAWEAAWPQVRQRLPEPVADLARPADERLARQLARQSEQARRDHWRAVREHQKAVARRERLLRRSRRALPTWSVIGGAAAVAMVPVDGGATLALAGLAGYGGLRAAAAARVLRRPPPVPALPPALQPGPPPPPHPRSSAFPAVRRLEHARAALVSLMPLVGPAGRPVAEEAWAAAGEADVALRWQAARLAAAEPYTGTDPAVLAALEQGVEAQERLVQAVADLVAATADPHGAARVQDLTDRLHGLAAGLREVR